MSKTETLMNKALVDLVKMAESGEKFFIVNPRRKTGKKYVEEMNQLINWLFSDHFILFYSKIIADQYQGNWLIKKECHEIFFEMKKVKFAS